MMRTRFAPSPNGLLHLGHAYSAKLAHGLARAMGGQFQLRIEDIDATRSRSEYVEAIVADLRWLGLDWDSEIVFQSDRLARYDAAAERLKAMGLLYPCSCTRSQIQVAAKAEGPEGPVYPGTCRPDADGNGGADCTRPHSWRLDIAKAAAMAGPLGWHDRVAGKVVAEPELFGDVVLLRKDAPASYHLAATLDDAADGMTHVVRGMDLFAATHIHRLLQALLDLPPPLYWHHALLTGQDGRKLSKSEQAPALSELREAGKSGPAVLDALGSDATGPRVFRTGILAGNP